MSHVPRETSDTSVQAYKLTREKQIMPIIGIGLDIVDIDLFRKRLSDELIEEIFLPEEVLYASSQARSWESFAARLAAKEATFKALGHGLSSGLRWKDVEVVRNRDTGDVWVRLHGEALRISNDKGINTIHLSITHSSSDAVAVVVALV